MPDDTRNAKLNLNVETNGDKEAARSLSKMTESVADIRDDFKGANKEAEALADTIRRDLKQSLSEAANVSGDIKPGGGGSGGGNLPAAAKFRGAASLFGGGEIVGFIDDMQDAIEGVQGLGGSLTQFLNPATITAGIAMVALALVIDDFAKGAQKQADQMNQIFSAQREVFDEIAGGATTEDINNQIAALQFRRELEQTTLQEATDAYASYEQQIRDTFGAFGDIILGILRIIDPREETLNAQKAESEKAIGQSEAKERQYTKALEQGLTAKNDAKAAEEDLKTARDKAAQEAEKAAQDAEREAERAAQAQERIQEQAAREMEQRAQQAAAAQQKYADGIKNANTALKQATADINTKLSQGLADNLEGMFRDVTDIATQYRRDTFDMDLKANQAERDALTEHYRDIDDIRDDALKSEQEALRDGDFKAAFLAKQAGADALKQEQKETLRERSDRTRALGDERADLLRNAQQTRSDRMLALERQNADTRTAAQRELQQATLTRTRALEMNAASYKSELAALGSFLQQRNNLLATANQAALANIGGRGGAGGLNNTGRSIQQQMAAAVGGIIRR